MKFISEYINNCAKSGICSPEEICAKAISRIQEIDIQLHEADNARMEKKKLLEILKTLGHEFEKEKKSKQKASVPVISLNVSPSELDSESKGYVKIICEHLGVKGKATNRELMTICNIDVQNDSIIYSLIKYLCANGILSKDEASRSISPGPNWEKHSTLF